MFRCLICKYDAVPLDDVVAGSSRTDACICLACYTRETETAVRMPDRLRRQLIRITTEV